MKVMRSYLGLLLAVSRTNAFQSRRRMTSFSHHTLSSPQVPFSSSHPHVQLCSTLWKEDDHDDVSYLGIEEESPLTPSGDDEKNDIGIPPSSSLWDKAKNQVPLLQLISRGSDDYRKLPPMQVEDVNLLLYDVFLLVNLSASISFWVTHRVDMSFIPAALSEGCLLSILWIAAGLYHGAFLMGAVDGHYGSTDDRGGPKAAAALAVNTFINTVSLRLLFAFGLAVLQHRPVGVGIGEELMPLEIGFGLALMTVWRGLHSYVTPRI